MITIENGTKIEFSNMGYFVGGKDWIHPEIIVPTYELIFVTHGEVFLEEDGVRYCLKAGDLLCLRPNLVHKGYKTSSDVKFYWLHFNAENYESIGVYRHTFSDAYNYSAFFKQLNHEIITGADKALTECKIAVFLLDIKNLGAKKSKIFFDVCEYIRVNVAQNPTVKNIAEHFSYHPDYLSKVFIKNSGTPLKNYIDVERNAYVKNLLLSTTMTLKEIAFACSFDSDNALIKFFKYNNKITPTEFRNRYYASHINTK